MIGIKGTRFDFHRLGQRGIGDLIEERIKQSYKEDAESRGVSWSDAPTVRSIQDFSIGKSTMYDVKATDLDREFSMPNLISAKRLDRLYADPSAELRYVFVSYKEVDGQKEIVESEERLIESIPWDCLAIQNLGEGQIQLIGKSPLPHYEGTREEWLAELRVHMVDYLERTIEKMKKRINYWKE